MQMLRRVKGFSLIEIMVVMAILGILASIGYSSYSSSTQKARRTDGKEALLRAAALQERWIITNPANTYAGNAAIASIGGNLSEEGYYSITASNTAMSGTDCPTAGLCFTITVVPADGSPQVEDSNCLSMTVDNLGRKRSYDNVTAGSGNETDNCW